MFHCLGVIQQPQTTDLGLHCWQEHSLPEEHYSHRVLEELSPLLVVVSVFRTVGVAGLTEAAVLLEAERSPPLDDDADELCCDEDVVEAVSDDDNNSHSHHNLQTLRYHH